MPVMRTYRARVHPDKVRQWEEYERSKGLPMVTSMPGCVSAGIARVAEAEEPTFVFFSLWSTREDLERARATPRWKEVAAAVAALGLTYGEDAAEHWEVLALSEGPQDAPRAHTG